MKLSDSDDKSDKPLEFSGNIECPLCGTLFEGTWFADVIDVEQIAGLDDFKGDQTCPNPNCGHVWNEPYCGWWNYSDAG